LDGWLIKSENYQALNTILPKFKERVQTIYIDPPFNTGSDFAYLDKFQDSAWLTLIENRLQLGYNLLKDTGSFYLHLDPHADYYGRMLMNTVFNKENFINEVIWFFKGTTNSPRQYADKHDTILLYVKNKNSNYIFNADAIRIPFKPSSKYQKDSRGRIYKQWTKNKKYYPPQELINGEYELLGKYRYDVIDDVPSMATAHGEEYFGFSTQKKEALLNIFLKASSNKNDLVMDFFLGSGTTTAVAHKLGRKWIGVEMGEHFWTVVLPRMKRVLAYDKSGISKEVKEYQGGGFFKYYELEQYEETLANCKYIYFAFKNALSRIRLHLIMKTTKSK